MRFCYIAHWSIEWPWWMDADPEILIPRSPLRYPSGQGREGKIRGGMLVTDVQLDADGQVM